MQHTATEELQQATHIPPGIFKGETIDQARTLIDIINDMREYWPLTVRQIYYQSVARLLFPNRQNFYAKVSRILTTLRRADLLPWHAIEDRTRRTIGKRGMLNVEEYVRQSLENFLDPNGYGRCYIQDQEVYVEVATEKDALSSIMADAVWYFCTRLNIVRGQVSATMVNAMAERFDRAVMLGKRPILLYLGDLDPSGAAIPKALVRNIADHHGVEIELMRVALNPAQVTQYNLPASLDAAKASDPNYKTWLAEYGRQAPVELDALHPRDLTSITKEALSSVYDMRSYLQHQDKEREERQLLRKMRRAVHDFIATEFPEVFSEYT